MTDVFISYAREDRHRAQILAQALEKQGFTVWWDRKIPPGKTFDEVIQEALEGTSCVIVLWSTSSVESDWVKEEAQIGAEREVLVPALIDAVPIPLGFGRIQTANLVGWRGDLDHPEFEQLSRSIAAIGSLQFDTRSLSVIRPDEIGTPAHPDAEPQRRRASAAPRPARPRSRLIPVAATLGLLAAAAGGGYYLFAQGLMDWSPTAEAQEPSSDEPSDEERAEERDLDHPVLEQPNEGSDPSDRTQEEIAAEDAERRQNEARAWLADVQRLEEAPQTRDAELLADYKEVRSQLVEDLEPGAADGLDQRIAALEESIQAFAEIERRMESGDLTVREQLALWQSYRPTRPEGHEALQVASEVKELTALIEGSATIASDDDLVIARDIRRDREGKPVGPRGVTDELPPGNVYLFAWVRSPGSERLEIQWRDGSGEVLQTQSTRVGQNLATGYRLAYYKRFSEPGEYEVRLYNQGGQLIGRRAFRIKS